MLLRMNFDDISYLLREVGKPYFLGKLVKTAELGRLNYTQKTRSSWFGVILDKSQRSVLKPFTKDNFFKVYS